METQEYSIFPDRPTEYGGFWPRLAAYVIDAIICYVAARVIELVLYFDTSLSGILKSLAFSLLWQWIYYAVQESSANMATVGKRAVGLKVTDTEGNRISFGKATGRYWGKLLSALVICLGYLWMLWDDRKQTWHDKLAGTLVLKA